MSPDVVRIKQNECEEMMRHVLTGLGAHMLEASCSQGDEKSWSQDRRQKYQTATDLDWMWQGDDFPRLSQARPFTSDFNVTPHWTFIVDDLLVDPSRLFHSADYGDGRHYHYVTSVVFPHSCCACLAPVTHYEAISLDATVEGNREAGEWRKCWYTLPFCDKHGLESHSVQITSCVFPIGINHPQTVFRVANREWGTLFGELNGLNGFGWGIRYFLLHGTEADLGV